MDVLQDTTSHHNGFPVVDYEEADCSSNRVSPLHDMSRSALTREHIGRTSDLRVGNATANSSYIYVFFKKLAGCTL